MVASIYMTVVIALERYIAVSRPISTYIRGGDEDGIIMIWMQVLKYVGPVILFSVVITISKFYEFALYCDPCDTTQCKTHICPDLRLNEEYIKYYINLFG